MNIIQYHDGQIQQTSDGKFSAAYLCKRLGGKPYQALAGHGHGYETVDDAKIAIDEANGAQKEFLSRVSAVNYDNVHKMGLNSTWYRPKFWGESDIIRVVHVGKSYILSTDEHDVYLSQSNSDCEFVFHLDANMDIFTQAKRYANWFENAKSKDSNSCHYCGSLAVATGFFGEPVCAECGGK